MRKIKNISTGEYTYIPADETIPEGWIDATYTIGVTSEAPAYGFGWIWLLLILFLAYYILSGKLQWKP